MEERKQKEIEYYDREVKEAEGEEKESGSLVGMNIFDLASYKFLYELAEKYCAGKKVLDYGCGTGTHLINLAKISKEVIGIDLSEKSLEVAKKRIEKQGIRNAEALLMDAENLKFQDNSFDVVFDGGTFSSLDLDKALTEIFRVLKPKGFLIGIETFGHNPLTNLKRKLNKKTGKRTEWAVEHIFKMTNLKNLEKFGEVKAKFFHLISWLAFPIAGLPAGKFVLKIGERLDSILLAIFPFLRRYAFKVVFVFSQPEK